MGFAHPGMRALLLGGLLLVAACGEPAADEPTTVLSVDPPFLELGMVPRGGRATGSWMLQNVSGGPLHVLRVGPLPCSCGSAELLLPDRPSGPQRFRVDDGQLLDLTLAEGERAELSFTFDSSRYRQPISRKVVSIPVILRDHPGVVVECAVDVWTPFVVEPWAIEMGEVGIREQASGFVVVAAHDDAHFGVAIDTEIEDWRVVSDQVSTPDSDRDSYRITVTAPYELPRGPFSQEFVLYTDIPDAPPIRFVAQGVAVPDLGASPRRVVFDPAAGQPEAKLQVWNRALEGRLGELSLLRVDGPVELVDQQQEAGATLRTLTLRWTGEAPADLRSGRLFVATGDAETPEIEVLWSVMPAR